MAKPVEFDPAALDELDEAAGKMNREDEGLGDELVAEARATVARVASAPEAFPFARDVEGVRSARVKRFRYRVFFVERPSKIRVLAIARSKRLPGYWRERLGSG